MHTTIVSMEKLDKNKYLVKTTFRVISMYINVEYIIIVQPDNSLVAKRIFCDEVPGQSTEINTKISDAIAESFREFWYKKTKEELKWES